ncbi:MAG: efflux RND transporter periplasmic adaptor subunit, partial [Ignavibacteriae bacterium]|nr:efflux RND transporter periplasmic adaptor subunit [Ignavibacteriota bacterium]
LATVAYSSPSQANAVLTASGYVVAQRKAAVASKGTGRLVFLGVEEGDRVKEGQIIARLEDDDVVASQQQARANRTVAEAEVKDAQQWHARQKQMLDRNLTSQAEYDAAETRLNRVNASVVAARAALTAATVAVENTRIRAPFDGTVLLKHADVGEIVAPFASASSSRGAVVTIADMTSLEVEADVSESNIFRITPNLPCEISLDAYPDQRYQGYVSKIVPTADRAKATVLVKVKFKSYDYRVLPEMSAKITFLSKEADASAVNAKSVLSVPSNAVATRDGREVVYKVADGSAKEVPIVTGKKLGSMVEVQEGLSSGDRVIARVDERINDGVKVVVK